MFCLFDTKAINAKNSDMFKNTLRANKYVKQYLTLEVVKEMQIQNTIRYHHTSIKMENKMEKKKKQEQVLAKMWSNLITYVLLVGLWNGTTGMESSMVAP